MLGCWLLAAPAALAEEVIAEHQGLEVIGNLEIAKGKSLKSDGAVLLLHGALAHHRMEIISAAQELLKERGINSLAITLGLGLDKRRGLFDCSLEQDHRSGDAVDETETWVNWLKEKGAANITLAGHSLGGRQAALYASGQPDKVVKRVVLIAPQIQTFESIEAEYQNQYHKPLKDELARAEQLIAEDEGSTFLEGAGFLNCPLPRVTAGAFADYYSASQKFNVHSLVPKLKIPALIVIGDQDPLEAELSTALQSMPAGKHVTYKKISGADHFFRDLQAEDLAERIKEFLGRKDSAPPRAAERSNAPASKKGRERKNTSPPPKAKGPDTSKAAQEAKSPVLTKKEPEGGNSPSGPEAN